MLGPLQERGHEIIGNSSALHSITRARPSLEANYNLDVVPPPFFYNGLANIIERLERLS